MDWVDAETARVLEIADELGCSLAIATRLALRDRLTAAVTEARSLDDLRSALLTLVEFATAPLTIAEQRIEPRLRI
ncbi:hypothetical protein, partial [Paracraurococcus ruber]